MVERKYEQEASAFCEAIKAFASRPEALDNFEGYLSYHFDSWMKAWANTPDGLAYEACRFAYMYD